MKFPEKPYVYLLFDENDAVYYVGKGRGRRAISHLSLARRKKDGERYEKIRQMLAGGHPYRFIIASTHETDKEAGAAESALIQYYGRDRLVNKTNGGEIGPVLRPVQRLAVYAQKIWDRVNEAGNGDHPLARIIKKESESPSFNMVSWSKEGGAVFGWHCDPSPGMPKIIEDYYANS
jgi:hypothetical protein